MSENTSFFSLLELQYSIESVDPSHTEKWAELLSLYRNKAHSSCDAAFSFEEKTPPWHRLERAVLLEKLGTNAFRRFSCPPFLFYEIADQYLAILDTERTELKVYATGLSALHQRLTCYALKWMIILAAIRKGYSYLHASAVQRRGTNTLFCGLSGSGKSSCSARTLAAGAKLITDDTLISDGFSYACFDMISSKNKDFRDRFKEGSSRFLNGTVPAANIPTVVILPLIRNSEHSSFELLTRAEADLQIEGINREEIDFNLAPALLSPLDSSWAQPGSPVTFYQFFAGRNEAEATKTLMKGLGWRKPLPKKVLEWFAGWSRQKCQ